MVGKRSNLGKQIPKMAAIAAIRNKMSRISPEGIKQNQNKFNKSE